MTYTRKMEGCKSSYFPRRCLKFVATCAGCHPVLPKDGKSGGGGALANGWGSRAGFGDWSRNQEQAAGPLGESQSSISDQEFAPESHWHRLPM